ncbi:recombinase family protein [Kitasatospora paranensis]|uniref:Recombinase family protein n=1 Tax=Kitasatospora paranensis TaxID=258053 RepID=A0ABW2G5D8_9ACTN
MNLQADGCRSGAAIYLRCYPFDESAMPVHRYAVSRFADQLGLPVPTVYLDNGCPSGGPLPALEQLIDLAASQAVRAVLVPGPFVFSLSDVEAHRVVTQLAALGCRVIELPLPRRVADGRAVRAAPAALLR